MKQPPESVKVLVPSERIERRIYLIRGHKVMLDSDLAELYDVPTKRLNEQVRRNMARFPADFMFQLTHQETQSLRSQAVTLDLRSQIATSRSRHGGRRYLPCTFTEQGVAMLSSVLNSEWAIQVNIAIMRAFVKLRETLTLHKDLARKLEALERKIIHHDAQIQSIFDAIRYLMAPPEKLRRRIGFHP